MTNSIGDPFEFDDMELSVNFYSVWHARLQMLFQEFQFYSSIRRWIDRQSQPVSQIGSKLACWLAKSNCLAYSQLCSQSAGVSHSKKLICFDCVLNNNFPAQPKTCINSQNKVKQAGRQLSTNELTYFLNTFWSWNEELKKKCLKIIVTSSSSSWSHTVPSS